MYTYLYVSVYTPCIHGEAVLENESERKVDMATCRVQLANPWLVCSGFGGRRMSYCIKGVFKTLSLSTFSKVLLQNQKLEEEE